MSSRTLASSLLAGVLLTTASAADFEIKPTSIPSRWNFEYQGRTLMVYESDPQKYKPYVRELATVKGDNILRDAPADHLHHHALMYGIKVNGINFWEEASGSGVQRVVSTGKPVARASAQGNPSVMFTQEIVWLPAADAFLPLAKCAPLLFEERTLTLTVTEARQETALLWHSKFKVGTRTNTVVLTGSTYHGLGMRFLRELDALAEHFSPAGKLDLSGNREDNSLAPWTAIAFKRAEKPATIALFGDPRNRRGQPNFFSMAPRFAYLSATQSLHEEPLTYKDGEAFELRYLVVLYPEIKDAAAISARFDEFKQQP